MKLRQKHHLLRHKEHKGTEQEALRTFESYRKPLDFDHIRNFCLQDRISPEDSRRYTEGARYDMLSYFPDLDHPHRFSEKEIWLALHYRNREIGPACDKARAKDWIGSRVGYEHVVPLLGVYENVCDLHPEELPEKFVLKQNGGCGSEEVLIIRDKTKIDWDRTRAVLSSWLYSWGSFGFAHPGITDERIPPAIVAEKYLDQGNGSPMLNDFKFYCCGGEPKFVLCISGRRTAREEETFVDLNWNVLPFTYRTYKAGTKALRPRHLDQMLSMCRTLTRGFPLVRVDFYEIGDRVYVGEMTFSPGLFLSFSSLKWEEKLGKLLRLPGEEGAPSYDGEFI